MIYRFLLDDKGICENLDDKGIREHLSFVYTQGIIQNSLYQSKI